MGTPKWRSGCSTDHVTEQCIEVAVLHHEDIMLMRSNQRPAETITVTGDEFRAFVKAVKGNQFDDLA